MNDTAEPSDAPAPPWRRLLDLVTGLRHAPPGAGRIIPAVVFGALCHALFAVAVGAMILVMYSGMTLGQGGFSGVTAGLVNLVLIVQFPLAHSALLTRRGRKLTAALWPGPRGADMSTTTFAVVASAQLSLLFVCWSPSGIVWWRAEGPALWTVTCLYALSWGLLIRASYDAGAEVQSGALGWMSVVQNRRPVYPDMPVTGLFRIIRQPIYLSFALTLWTVPVWTPDQLGLAVLLTLYCVFAPRLKEKRFSARYGAGFDAYRAQVPYMLPWRRSGTQITRGSEGISR
ncbi:isoprenylcysteine carboxylmethyltransferase family protein [uncultured Roseobacter sp.]|uniref:methyltransferase family protein n=1 Tax=uncultured Roseobacter sp. TaxID=114847 RepID=UPI002634C1DB|nr:isoprenylcysteine carboxylmethyltransferase family protein [uncultured Roseobacter sp.]